MFVVDRTAPVVTVSGLEKNGNYQTESQTVTIIPTDDGGSLSSIKVLAIGDDGSVIATYLDYSGETLVDALENGDNKLTFELPEGSGHNIKIVSVDKSGNMYDSGEDYSILQFRPVVSSFLRPTSGRIFPFV